MKDTAYLILSTGGLTHTRVTLARTRINLPTMGVTLVNSDKKLQSSDQQHVCKILHIGQMNVDIADVEKYSIRWNIYY